MEDSLWLEKVLTTLQTKFYTTMTPPYTDGTLMPSMFSTIDPAYHKALKQPVASSFSMTSIRKFEPYVDQCSDIFISAMRARAGQKVDLSDWCQFYAFDVIGAITFQYRFGFMEQGKDVDGMMGKIWTVLTYAGIVGQIPEFHPWLVGNQNLMHLLKRLGVPDPNPFPKIIQVGQDHPSRLTKFSGFFAHVYSWGSPESFVHRLASCWLSSNVSSLTIE